MPNAFDITTASTTVPIDDATRKGVASYTVKNTCGRPLRGEARLETNQPQMLEAGKEWIKFDGSPFRDFTTDGAEQFTVQIGVPTQAPAGTYGFWLKMVGIENPDEMTDIGPNIDFNVKELPKPVPWWKKLKWWVWAIAGGVLLLIIAVILVLALVPLTPASFTDPITLDSSWIQPSNTGIDLGSNQALVLINPFFGISINQITVQSEAVLPHNRVRIRSAILRMHVSGGNIFPDPVRISASKTTAPWSEALGSPTPSCDPQPVSTLPIGAGTTVIDIDVTEIYQQLIDDGANNFGICLTSPDPQYRIVVGSSEAPDASLQPVIIVDYRHTVFGSN